MMEEIVLAKNQKFVGNTTEVLVEKCEPQGLAGVCSGNSGEMKLVNFTGTPEDVGKIVRVKINKVREWVLEGEKANSQSIDGLAIKR